MHQSLKYFCAKILNYVIPKKKNSIFAEPHKNGRIDHQDIINYAGDSVLTFLNYMIDHYLLDNRFVYLVIYETTRVKEIEKYLNDKGIRNVHLIIHYSCFTGIKKNVENLKYHLKKMKTIIWLCGTVHENKRYAISVQKLVCLNYYISFKNDYKDLPFEYLPKKWSLVCSSSMFDSVIKSATYAIPFDMIVPLGLARNDYLFKRTSKEDQILNWIESKMGKRYSKIILYTPTFRDYEMNETRKRNIWGYSDNTAIDEVLEKNDTIVIAKMHTWQNLDVITSHMNNLLIFEPNYDFTIYDLMTIGDVMITDYSSIGLDFLLIGKPVIYNLYDKDLYMRTRGMCIEPIENICGGYIVEKESDLAMCIDRTLSGDYIYENMNNVRDLYFKNKDGKSCDRIFRYLTDNNIL